MQDWISGLADAFRANMEVDRAKMDQRVRRLNEDTLVTLGREVRQFLDCHHNCFDSSPRFTPPVKWNEQFKRVVGVYISCRMLLVTLLSTGVRHPTADSRP